MKKENSLTFGSFGYPLARATSSRASAVVVGRSWNAIRMLEQNEDITST